MVPENIAFGFIAAAMVLAALRVVTTKNVIHSALYLIVVLGGVAGLYVLAAAEFAAAVQILVYIGAIVVLFLFGLMLTRAPLGRSNNLDNDQRWLAAVVALFFCGVLSWVLIDAFGNDKLNVRSVGTSADVANSIFSQYLMPFEILSMLLLAALVGAVVIARRD